jgi:hypothetical protein
MRKDILAAIVLCLCAGSALGDSNNLKLSIAPIGGYNFGTTKYTMNGTEVASELDFPLDFATGGVRAELNVLKDGLSDWTVSAEFVSSLNDPGGYFTDRDWDIAADGTRLEFSNTKSNVQGSMTSFRGEVAKLVYRGTGWDLAVFAGFSRQSVSQDAIDVTGWQVVSDTAGNSFVVHFSYEALALSYDIDYYRPLLGVAPRFYINPNVLLEGRIAGSPFLYLEDLDNHRLRGFTAVSDGHGYGFNSRVALRIRPGHQALNQKGFFVGVVGDYSYTTADLKALIVFYEDNDLEGYSKGDRIPGIPHKITSSQFNVGVKVGVVF